MSSILNLHSPAAIMLWCLAGCQSANATRVNIEVCFFLCLFLSLVLLISCLLSVLLFCLSLTWPFLSKAVVCCSLMRLSVTFASRVFYLWIMRLNSLWYQISDIREQGFSCHGENSPLAFAASCLHELMPRSWVFLFWPMPWYLG